MGLIEREWLPVGAFMVAMAVCEIPTDTALEVLRIARASTDDPPPHQGAVDALAKISDLAKYLGEPAWNEEGCRLVAEQITRLAAPHLNEEER